MESYMPIADLHYISVPWAYDNLPWMLFGDSNSRLNRRLIQLKVRLCALRSLSHLPPTPKFTIPINQRSSMSDQVDHTKKTVTTQRSDELAQVMLAWYTDRHHCHQVTIQEFRTAYHNSQEALQRVYHDARALERENDRLVNRNAELGTEVDGLLNIALSMVQWGTEEQQRRVMQQITGLFAMGEAAVDLETDEEMTETDEE